MSGTSFCFFLSSFWSCLTSRPHSHTSATWRMGWATFLCRCSGDPSSWSSSRAPISFASRVFRRGPVALMANRKSASREWFPSEKRWNTKGVGWAGGRYGPFSLFSAVFGWAYTSLSHLRDTLNFMRNFAVIFRFFA